MPDPISVVVGDYPHTKELKARDAFAGVPATFPHISPIHDAFDNMVRTQRYDVCEMAIGAFLQARAAGKPLLLLPVVMVGSFHHKSIYASPVDPARSPEELRGKRIGVRAYSQTTGLWVRGWLAEEYGVTADSVTWVTTEGSHAEDYQDPANVVHTDGSLTDHLRAGEIAAAILGPSAATPDLRPLLEDPQAADREWYGRHGTVPLNHMVVTTSAVVEHQGPALREVYNAICAGIDETAGDGTADALPSAICHGVANVREAVKLAAGYALEQALIAEAIDDIDALFALDAS